MLSRVAATIDRRRCLCWWLAVGLGLGALHLEVRGALLESEWYVDTDICEPTVTTASGSYAPTAQLCRGQLIFSEEFDGPHLDRQLWTHEQRLSSNGEFQWYVNDTENSYVANGHLVIMPTLTVDVIPDLTRCSISIPKTVCQAGVCDFKCSVDHPAPPVRSARLKTNGRFNFRYGRVEIRAKLPAGDWLWPALWLIPSRSVYGTWPQSGEIDVMESRGNRDAPDGPNRVSSTLHFGTSRAPSNSAWRTAHFERALPPGQLYSDAFHVYQLIWTPDSIEFHVDNRFIGRIATGDGYFKRGRFKGNNIWANGQRDAPFDQEFHIILNTAVGGVSGFFSDGKSKPWRNKDEFALREFWKHRAEWLPTWRLDGNAGDAALQVDFVRVWAV